MNKNKKIIVSVIIVLLIIIIGILLAVFLLLRKNENNKDSDNVISDCRYSYDENNNINLDKSQNYTNVINYIKNQNNISIKVTYVNYKEENDEPWDIYTLAKEEINQFLLDLEKGTWLKKYYTGAGGRNIGEKVKISYSVKNKDAYVDLFAFPKGEEFSPIQTNDNNLIEILNREQNYKISDEDSDYLQQLKETNSCDFVIKYSSDILNDIINRIEEARS